MRKWPQSFTEANLRRIHLLLRRDHPEEVPKSERTPLERLSYGEELTTDEEAELVLLDKMVAAWADYCYPVQLPGVDCFPPFTEKRKLE